MTAGNPAGKAGTRMGDNRMNKVTQWVKPAIRAMQAYPVPDAGGFIKLDAMENPYNLPDTLKHDWLTELESVSMNRYPDAGASMVKDRLREVMAIPDDMGLVLGNGSDELIQMIAMAVAEPGRCFLTPEPGFAMYRLIANTVGVDYCGVSLDASDFSLDTKAILIAIAEKQPAVVFLACPNNPTGNLFDKSAVLEIVRAAPGLVVIDEAYHAFAGETYLPNVADFDNLLVMRTLSKSGLAGLRLGYLTGPHEWLDEFEKIRLPYNINALTQVTVSFMLRHQEVLAEQAAQICGERERLYGKLVAHPPLQVWPSRANFLLFRVNNQPADVIHSGLKEQGILIKNLHGSHPLLENCLRVTVGTEEENGRFIAALEKLI